MMCMDKLFIINTAIKNIRMVNFDFMVTLSMLSIDKLLFW